MSGGKVSVRDRNGKTEMDVAKTCERYWLKLSFQGGGNEQVDSERSMGLGAGSGPR